MSWTNFDAGNFDMQMVKRDVCLEWFHGKRDTFRILLWIQIYIGSITNVKRCLELLWQ